MEDTKMKQELERREMDDFTVDDFIQIKYALDIYDSNFSHETIETERNKALVIVSKVINVKLKELRIKYRYDTKNQVHIN